MSYNFFLVAFFLSSTALASHKVVATKFDSTYSLGSSYNVDKDMFQDVTCLNPTTLASVSSTPDTQFGQKGDITVKFITSTEAMLDEVDAQLDLSWISDKFNANAKFIDKISKSAHTSYLLIKYEVDLEHHKLKIGSYEKLKELHKGLSTFIDSTGRLKSNFAERCGHEYISSITFGGRFYAVLSFEHSSDESKKLFDAALEKAGTNNSTSDSDKLASYFQEASNSNSSFKLNFTLKSVGGNLEEVLDTIFGYQSKDEDGDKDGSRIADFLGCSVGSMLNCQNLMKGLLLAGNHFLETVSQNSAPLYYQTDDYIYVVGEGVDMQEVKPENIPVKISETPTYISAYEELVTNYVTIQKQINVADSLLKGNPVTLSSDQKDTLESVFLTLAARRDRLKMKAEMLRLKPESFLLPATDPQSSAVGKDLALKNDQLNLISPYNYISEFSQLCLAHKKGIFNSKSNLIFSSNKKSIENTLLLLLDYVNFKFRFTSDNTESLSGKYFKFLNNGEYASYCEVVGSYLKTVSLDDLSAFKKKKGPLGKLDNVIPLVMMENPRIASAFVRNFNSDLLLTESVETYAIAANLSAYKVSQSYELKLTAQPTGVNHE